MKFPYFHFDFVALNNRAIFKFLEYDLERLKSEGLSPKDILPPNGECMEGVYIEQFISHALQNAERYPWVSTRQGINTAIETMSREYRFLLAYEHSGKKTYYFSEGLTEKLCYSKMDMKCDSFLLPEAGFAFVFDSPLALEAFSAIDSQPIKEGSVVTVYLHEGYAKVRGFRCLHICIYLTKDGQCISSVSRQLALKSSWNMEMALHTDWSDPGMCEAADSPKLPISMTTSDDGKLEFRDEKVNVFNEKTLQLIRLTLNGVEYLRSADAEVVEHGGEPLSGRPIQKYFRAGQSVCGF